MLCVTDQQWSENSFVPLSKEKTAILTPAVLAGSMIPKNRIPSSASANGSQELSARRMGEPV